MKKNFLVTTGLTDAWEFNENNFLLGKWCEFYEITNYDKNRFNTKKISDAKIIRNIDHWDDYEKRDKDQKYLKRNIEYLLEIISDKLSMIHNISENKEYWRVIIYNWLASYTTTIFDRWEVVRIFFEKNKNEKFFTYSIPFKELDYPCRDHERFNEITQKDEWNHIIFLRIFNFINIKNLSLIDKKISHNKPKNKIYNNSHNFSLKVNTINLIDFLISKIAFKFNKIIFESFRFPKKEYLKICLRFKLIPAKYSNFFNFVFKENNLLENDKRIKLKNFLSKVENSDKFIQFLLSNLHQDIPISYLENFHIIKKKILPLAKEKKIIFSMYSLYLNDNFKIYLAETKKVGSKYIHAMHGGGFSVVHPFFDFFEKVSDKVVVWDNTKKKQNISVNLSPTLPIIKLKNPKAGNYCSIVFCEYFRYVLKSYPGPGLNRSVDFFNELTHFVEKLKPEIKSKIKFRVKNSSSMNTENKFSEIFGEKYIDKVTIKNPFLKTILNSKLIIVTYAQTAFAEAMYSNIPTILILNKNHWLFSETSWQTFDILKENKIAFESFDEARIHINEHWEEINKWWYRENVQSARKVYLSNFFNVKSNWYKEWSDYIHFSSSLK